MSNCSRIDSKLDTLAALSVFAFAFISFCPSIMNGFAFDDLIHITQNSALRSLPLLIDSLTKPLYPGNLYRPVLISSYYLNYSLGGLEPFSFHLVNLGLHALNALLVYKLGRQLISGRFSAFACACMFAAHPIHTEAVANISGRAELLCATFILSTLLVYLRKPEGRDFLQICICALLSLGATLSKESGFVLPLLLTLLAFRNRVSLRIFTTSSSFLGVALGCGASLFLRLQAINSVTLKTGLLNPLDNALLSVFPSERAVAGAALLFSYLRLLIFPDRLSADYSVAVLGIGNILSTAGFLKAICMGGLALFGFYCLLRKKDAGLWILWFFAAFSVTSNILLPIGTIFAERLTYLPSIGVFAILSKTFFSTASWRNRTALATLLSLYSVYSWNQSTIWKDSQSLWSYQIKITPQSAKTQSNYATVLRNRGELTQARIHAENAIEISLRSADPLYLLGSIDLIEGKIAAGQERLEEALQYEPNHLPTLNLLGRLYLNQRNFNNAQILFERLLKNNPQSSAALLGLGTCALNQGNTTKAKDFLTHALLLDPENTEIQAVMRRAEQR